MDGHRMAKESVIPIYFLDTRIDEMKFSQPCRNEEKILFCPNCMKYTNLGRRQSEEPFRYEKEFTFHESTLDVKSDDEYREHVMDCISPLNVGVNRIDKTSDSICFHMVESFSKWCRRETRYDSIQVFASDFNGKEEEVIAFIYKNEVGPISYLAYRQKQIFDLDENIKNLWFLWDLFTFNNFRNNGYASLLLEESIKELKINTNLLPISGPVTKKSRGLVESFSTDKIMLWTQAGLLLIEKKNLGNYLKVF